ncbi:MAG: hypothetical protein NVSMB51_17500 [Solirubrobacteraceae bacterium]
MNSRGAAACVLVLVSGCGSGTLTREAFLTQANRICSDSARRLARLAAPAPARGAQPAFRDGYVDAYVAEMRDELARLRRLGFPPGGRRSLENVYRQLGDELAVAQRRPAAFARHRLSAINTQLKAYGITACRT